MAAGDDLFSEIGALRERGEPAALATVIGTRGSTPGRAAMKMLVRADGSTRGTSRCDSAPHTLAAVRRAVRCVLVEKKSTKPRSAPSAATTGLSERRVARSCLPVTPPGRPEEPWTLLCSRGSSEKG